MEYYSWIDHKDADIQSLVHVINLHGQELIGAEIGVYTAKSFCTLLQNCPNIKTLYGVDPYTPYADFVKPHSESGAYPALVDEKNIELAKLIAYHNIKYSGVADKAVFYEMPGNVACDKFEDESLDFIFIDSYIGDESETPVDQILNDLNVWITKVKKGGIVAGHDWNVDYVRQAVSKYRQDNHVERTMSTFDDLWCWIK